MTYDSTRRSAIAVVIATFAFNLLLTGQGAGQQDPRHDFARRAAVSNMFEIETAKLSLEKGKDASAKKFAHDMIDDHSRSLAELRKAAETEKVDLPSELDPENTKKLTALSSATPENFDQAYLSTQVTAHEDAVALFTTYSKDGPDGLLKNYAETSLGTVRTHNIRVHAFQGSSHHTEGCEVAPDEGCALMRHPCLNGCRPCQLIDLTWLRWIFRLGKVAFANPTTS